MKYRVKVIFCFLILFAAIAIAQGWKIDNKIRRIIIEEYPGGTILPTKLKNELIHESLYDGRFLKIKLYDYRGKMYLECFSKDSILIEKGNYVNSLSLLKKYVYSYASGTKGSIIDVIEYYQPLRNGNWLFYDSTGKFVDSIFYNKGIKILYDTVSAKSR